MKTFCGFIGWIIGMFLGFMVMNSVPFLGLVFILGGIPLGRYIGGSIEESRENERRVREENDRRRRQYEYELQQKRQRKSEALSLAHRYPEATKKYFQQHWGIIKDKITDFDITDDKVDILLSHKWAYDRDEENLNAYFRAQKEAERQAYRLREEQRREAERQAELSRQRAEEQIKKSLPSKVSSWFTLGDVFHYTYILNYYPTTCAFEATESEWEDRKTVWNFKNTPGKTSSTAHKRALDNVIPLIISKLITTFGKGSLKYLTLVCIPASTSLKTEARYKDFSKRLCEETGMTNAYDKIRVVAASEEKKFGGSGINTANLYFENSFFRGKYVLLFDDVITKGDSMLRFQRKMEELGAVVVGGFSIGRTKHNR